MPPKAAAAPPEPEVPARPLTVEEKRALFLKKLPDLKTAGDAAAVKEIIEGMKAHEAVEQIQVMACRQLAGLASMKDHAAAAEKRDLIRKFAGVEQVLKALGAHGACEELHREAFASLGHLTNSHNAKVKERMGELGAIERIVAAMRAFKSDLEVQALGCKGLHNLAHVSHNATKIAVAGGIEQVTAAMERHDNLDVQLHGSGALQVLSISADNRGRIVAAGGLERLVSAMVRFDNVDVAESCCGALVNVGCATPQMKSKLVATRGVQGVRSAFQKVMHHPEAKENTKAYGNLILDGLALKVYLPPHSAHSHGA